MRKGLVFFGIFSVGEMSGHFSELISKPAKLLASWAKINSKSAKWLLWLKTSK
jgi:hypothetical protein